MINIENLQNFFDEHEDYFKHEDWVMSREDYYIERLNQLSLEDRLIFIEKVREKYASDVYKDKEYSLGYEPRNVLIDIILCYGDKYGIQDKQKKEAHSPFHADVFIIDDVYEVGVVYGQGNYSYLKKLIK